MADGPSESVSEASSSSLGEVSRVISEEYKTAKRKRYYAERDATKVYLYEQHARWRDLKAELTLKTDKELSKELLDFYLSSKERHLIEVGTQTEGYGEGEIEYLENLGPLRLSPSTPLPSIRSPLMTSTPVGGNTAAGENRPSTSMRRRLLDTNPPSPITYMSTANVNVALMEETVTASESDEEMSDDDTFLPTTGSLALIAEMSMENVDDLDKTSIESEVFDTEVGETPDGDGPETGPVSDEDSVPQASATIVAQEVVQMKKCIIFWNKIMELLISLHGTMCKRKECGRQLIYNESFVGTCFVVNWKCDSGHFGSRWASQPTCAGVRAGNLLLASAIALSGNSFTKTGFLFKIMNLRYFSESLFNQYQHLYIAPSVNEYWEEMRMKLWRESQGKDVILSSDGRNDSPGHCAQYCTYSFADMDTKAILNVSIVDVREVEGRKSPNMERIGFERGLHELQQSDMKIKEIVTDGHTEIGALFKNSEKYKDIVHQRDIWHGGKSIAKKLTAVAKEKGNEDLSLWVSAVRNHFWYCSRQCKGSVCDFKYMWIGLLHHVVNEHTWILTEGMGNGQCAHGVLEDDRQKPWLAKNSPAHDALRKVILNKRFLNTLPYFVNFRHTGFIESFHNHLLMYCPKRHSYSFIGYKMRNQLAAIDFNSHRGRQVAKTADGKKR